MATRTIVLTGAINWAKVFEDNRDMEGFEGAYSEHDGGYTVNMVLGAEDFAELKASGSMKKGSVVDDGISVKFLRKHTDRFDWASGAPTVTKADGTPWDYEVDGIIPNGSMGEVTLSVYDTSRKSIKGTRLESLKVTEVLVEDEGSDEVPF